MADEMDTMLVVANPAKGPVPYDDQVILYDLASETMLARQPGVREVANTDQVQYLLMRGVLRKATTEEASAFRNVVRARQQDVSELEGALAKIRELEAQVAAQADAPADPDADVPADVRAQHDPGAGSTGAQLADAVEATVERAKPEPKGKGK